MKPKHLFYFKLCIALSILLVAFISFLLYLPYWHPEAIINRTPSNNHALHTYIKGIKYIDDYWGEYEVIDLNESVMIGPVQTVYHLYPRFDYFCTDEGMEKIVHYIKDDKYSNDEKASAITLLDKLNAYKLPNHRIGQHHEKLHSHLYNDLVLNQLKRCDNAITDAVSQYIWFNRKHLQVKILSEFLSTNNRVYRSHLIECLQWDGLVLNNELNGFSSELLDVYVDLSEKEKRTIIRKFDSHTGKLSLGDEFYLEIIKSIENAFLHGNSSEIGDLLYQIRDRKMIKGSLFDEFITLLERIPRIKSKKKHHSSKINYKFLSMALEHSFIHCIKNSERTELLNKVLEQTNPRFLIEYHGNRLWRNHPDIFTLKLKSQIIEQCLQSTKEDDISTALYVLSTEVNLWKAEHKEMLLKIIKNNRFPNVTDVAKELLNNNID